ncbi:MAG: hypothetical protein ABR567_23065 [Myxococcales bacterium]|nr:hypothetical protein [Myxococcales bacterium]
MKRLWLIGAIGIGAGIAWALTSGLWAERQPEWPSRKKLRREARRAEAARRAQEQAPVRPPEVHVEKEAETGLKVPLGDLTR